MMNDAEAIKLALLGREEGFRAIFANHGDFLFTHALRFLRNRELAEDAVQETLTAAFRSLATFRGDARLRTWLYRILRNNCLRLIGKNPVAQPILVEPAGNNAATTVEQRLDVAEILDRLAERDRSILLLTYWDELPLKEASDILEISENNAKIVLFRARKRFAELWQRHGRKEGKANEV
ncbi:MAG: RNA polymerase sigma factor SigM [Candidatus Riflebacteria bacterium HGW-Riflebacteria-2]|jgi:RNA polymerase sigma-70 factor (ECF subfamily)|nr:MAG: RNA polymerase sigma factor SigM [Candidatus Riflebacteria bacterium HGW-Riflebacteria-2]